MHVLLMLTFVSAGIASFVVATYEIGSKSYHLAITAILKGVAWLGVAIWFANTYFKP